MLFVELVSDLRKSEQPIIYDLKYCLNEMFPFLRLDLQIRRAFAGAIVYFFVDSARLLQ